MKCFNQATFNKLVLIALMLLSCSIANHLGLTLKRTVPSTEEYNKAMELVYKIAETTEKVNCKEYEQHIQTIVNHFDNKRDDGNQCLFSCSGKDLRDNSEFDSYVEYFRKHHDTWDSLDFIMSIGESSRQTFFKCGENRSHLKFIRAVTKAKNIITFFTSLKNLTARNETVNEHDLRQLLANKNENTEKCQDYVPVINNNIEQLLKEKEYNGKCNFNCPNKEENLKGYERFNSLVKLWRKEHHEEKIFKAFLDNISTFVETLFKHNYKYKLISCTDNKKK